MRLTWCFFDVLNYNNPIFRGAAPWYANIRSVRIVEEKLLIRKVSLNRFNTKTIGGLITEVHHQRISDPHPKKKKKKVMQLAAVSANLAPGCRNSQRGIKKLLEGSGSWRTGTSSTVLLLLREHPLNKTVRQAPRPHTQCRRLPAENQRVEDTVRLIENTNMLIDSEREKMLTFLILLPLVEHLDLHRRIFFPCVFFHQADQEGCKAQYRMEWLYK